MKIFHYWIIVLATLTACQSDSQQTDTQEEERPLNVVVIFTDDQGYEDLGVYGAKGFETPHIDQMAKEGIRFTQFYVSQPVCSASRASLLTGCYSNRIGINGALFPNAKVGLHHDEVTIAEVLKPLGYSTAIFGKWHLGDHPDFLPTKQGFDEYYGIPFSNDMWPLHPANDRFNFDPLPLIDGDSTIQYLEDQSMITTWYTEHAVSFIERNKDKPFFLYVPHSMPHVPLYVSDKFKGKTEKGLYGDVIAEIDWSTGQILDALKRNGLDKNTLVIYTSDNGPWLSYGEHSGSALPLREGKGTAWEGGVRVPCIMRWPGTIPAGTVSDRPAMTIDILPTIAKLTGGKLPTHVIDGKDISVMLKGEADAKSPQNSYFFYYKNNELHAVLKDKWKLYLPHTYRSLNGRTGAKGGIPIDYDQNKLGQMELYDLSNDVSETTNVMAQNPQIVQQLMREVEHARSELGDRLTDRVGSGIRPAGKVLD